MNNRAIISILFQADFGSKGAITEKDKRLRNNLSRNTSQKISAMHPVNGGEYLK